MGSPYPPDDRYTVGEWDTEAESARAFDSIVEGSGLFRVFKEVTGSYQAYRPSSELARPRIDRILWPSAELRNAGWSLGPIGVELKRSGMKLGRPLGQVISYTRASFQIQDVWVTPEWFFLWPMTRQFGPMQSILASLRCGGAFSHPIRQTVIFHSASVLAEVGPDMAEVRAYNAEHGRKVGSR